MIASGLTPPLRAAGPGPVVGRELFVRQWVPDDPRTRGGDGLGPLFNASSCVECHRVGGTGGSGHNGNNVRILVPLVNGKPTEAERAKRIREELVPLHAGFATSASLVLHRHTRDDATAKWFTDRPDATASFRFQITQRNTPALFGAGLIDAIPDAVIEAAGRRSQQGGTPGRVPRRPDGTIGRFGWKAQAATLDEFVRNACSIELGLEVPGRHQVMTPDGRGQAPGLDLSDAECQALTEYVRALPRPVNRPPHGLVEAWAIGEGRKLFSTVGCESCHLPTLGTIHGLYSDLLLHDLGGGLVDAGAYYGTPLPESPGEGPRIELATGEPPKPAEPSEWRTPPLWGMRDSGPYLHDGRAATIEQAIHLHGGQGEPSARSFAALNPADRTRLRTFLFSLAAPPPGIEGR